MYRHEAEKVFPALSFVSYIFHLVFCKFLYFISHILYLVPEWREDVQAWGGEGVAGAAILSSAPKLLPPLCLETLLGNSTLRSTLYCTLRSVLDNTSLSSAPKLLPPLCSETVLCSALYSVLSVILYSLLREVCYSTLCSVPKLLPASLSADNKLYAMFVLLCTALYSAQYVDKNRQQIASALLLGKGVKQSASICASAAASAWQTALPPFPLHIAHCESAQHQAEVHKSWQREMHNWDSSCKAVEDFAHAACYLLNAEKNTL